MNGWIMQKNWYVPGAANVTAFDGGTVGVVESRSSAPLFQNPLPCSTGVSAASAPGGSLG